MTASIPNRYCYEVSVARMLTEPHLASLAQFSIPRLDLRFFDILAEDGFDLEVFSLKRYLGYMMVELYGLHLTIDLLNTLKVTEGLDQPRTAHEILEMRGFGKSFEVPLRWLLKRLAEAGLLATKTGDGECTYQLGAALPQTRLDWLRTELLNLDSDFSATVNFLDAAASLYPQIAEQQISGEAALLGKFKLWADYFSNSNPHYAPNNLASAVVAANCLRPEGNRILEVGAGLGSATEFLLKTMKQRDRLATISDMQVTDSVAFFCRLLQRNFESTYSNLPLTFRDFDINRPWAAQRCRPQQWDLVWGVNVFHLAQDLDFTLREAFEALTPGGWLVIGECIRRYSGEPITMEIVFQILRSFVDVKIDPQTRPTHGFLTLEQWSSALTRAGFVSIKVVPDLARLSELMPPFNLGAVCGRRS